MSARLFKFGCVGAAAAAVHLGVVSWLVPRGMPPLASNVAGFALAFQVTYFGHRGWTFRDSAGGSYAKMLVVSLISFAVNELLYACLLRVPGLDYRVALIMVLIVVAALTFIASRSWVFKKIS